MTDAELLTAALADRYRVDRELGQGGMATVYLAHDVKHDRKVAVKVLRPELAAVIGADRFLAEIRTTANLQHPHIVPLFDSGTADSFLFYVMPHIEGISLRDRLTREKQLPIGDAIRIASEVAGALDYAHRHGVIHRDIKPENILLHDGSALVADFGIALAASKAGGARMTETGMSIGTPQYMSPEQAMGEREITARSDVYALGCVLYEMLVGEPPFTGPSAQAIVAKVLTERPPAARSKRSSVPEHVQTAIETALEKLPADRFQTAAEFAAALVPTAGAPRRDSQPPSRPAPRQTALLATLGVATVAAAFLLGGRLLGGRVAPPLTFGRSIHVTWDPGLEIAPALSPDGRAVAYAVGSFASMRIFVRPVAEGRAIPLTGDTADVETNPQWSPDGTRILFLARGGTFSAPAAGGPARPEIPGVPKTPVTSAAWAPDGQRIVFARGDSVFVRERDASTRPLVRLAEPALCVWSPNGQSVACAVGNVRFAAVTTTFGNLSPSRIVVCRVSDGSVATVTDSSSLNQSPTWSADAKWLYFISNRDGPRDIYAVPITGGGQAGGPPLRLSTGLGAHSISLAGNGSRIAFASYSSRTAIWSLPVPDHPPVSTAGAQQVTNASENIETMSVSPDGKWLFYTSDLSGNSDIFRFSLSGGEPDRLTTDPADDFYPKPSPNGREIAFHSWRSGSRDIYVLPLDGSPLQQVTNSPAQEANAEWSPDGSSLAFSDFSAGGIWIVHRDPQGRWSTPVRRVDKGYWPVWSPDGRQLAYLNSLAEGSLRVIPVDSGPQRILLDPMVNGQPRVEQSFWNKNGLIYFKSHDAKGAASIWSIPAMGGAPRLLVQFDEKLHPSYRPNWAMGGGRFYFSSEDRQSDIWVMEVAKPR